MIHRREFLKSAAGSLLVSRIAMSSQSPSITRLTDTLSVVTDVGTNVLLFSTNDGLVLVDSGAPQHGAALTARIGSKRVRTVFNTHYHLENTGSNEALG